MENAYNPKTHDIYRHAVASVMHLSFGIDKTYGSIKEATGGVLHGRGAEISQCDAGSGCRVGSGHMVALLHF